MRDSFEEIKKADRKKAMEEAERHKQAFIREVRNGLGVDMEKELRIQAVAPPPSKWRKMIKRLKKTLGI